MSRADDPPRPPADGRARVRLVAGFDELCAARFADGVNALCWPRALEGDFGEVADRLGAGESVEALDEARLGALALGPAGRAARDVLLHDLHLLREHGLAPELNCVRGYERDDPTAIVATDVFSFHADRAPIEAATWLCTYHGPPSECLVNEEARRRVDDPTTRAALLAEYGGSDDDGFAEFLRESCYDLHFTPEPRARPYSLGVGHLWRIALDWPGCPVPPCLHRAPATRPGETRLLLIS